MGAWGDEFPHMLLGVRLGMRGSADGERPGGGAIGAHPELDGAQATRATAHIEIPILLAIDSLIDPATFEQDSEIRAFLFFRTCHGSFPFFIWPVFHPVQVQTPRIRVG